MLKMMMISLFSPTGMNSEKGELGFEVNEQGTGKRDSAAENHIFSQFPHGT